MERILVSRLIPLMDVDKKCVSLNRAVGFCGSFQGTSCGRFQGRLWDSTTALWIGIASSPVQQDLQGCEKQAASWDPSGLIEGLLLPALSPSCPLLVLSQLSIGPGLWQVVQAAGA